MFGWNVRIRRNNGWVMYIVQEYLTQGDLAQAVDRDRRKRADTDNYAAYVKMIVAYDRVKGNTLL